MKSFFLKYKVLITALIVIGTGAGIALTHSNPYLCGGIFLLGAVAGFLVGKNNPNTLDTYGRKA